MGDIKKEINQIKDIEPFFDILAMYQEQWNELQVWLNQEIRCLTSAFSDKEYKLSVAIALYFLKNHREKLENLIADKHLFLKLTKTTDLCFQKYQGQDVIEISCLIDYLLSQEVFNNEYGLESSIAICFEYFPNKISKVYDLLYKKNLFLANIIRFILTESHHHQRDDGILDYLDNLFSNNPIKTPKGHIYCRDLKSWFLLKEIKPNIKDKILSLAVKWLTVILENSDIASKLTVNQENGLVVQILLAIICHQPSKESFILLKSVLANSELMIGFKFEAMMYAYDLYGYIPNEKSNLILQIAQKEAYFPTGYYEGKYPLEQFLANEKLCDIESLLLIAKLHHYDAAQALKQRKDVFEYLPQIIDALIDIIGNIITWMIDETYKYYHLQYVGYFLDFLAQYQDHITDWQNELLFGHLYKGLSTLRRSEIVGYYIRFHKKIPESFECLINPWDKHSLVWQQKNTTWTQLYQKLIKALVVRDIPIEKTEGTHFESLIMDSKNSVMWDRKDNDTSDFDWFGEFVKTIAPDLKINRLEIDKYDVEIDEVYICLNKDNINVDWSDWPLDYYFECQEKMYFFRIFYCQSQSIDIRSIAAIVDNWMEMLGRPARYYELYTEGYGSGELFFSADPLYFQEFIDDYAIPAKRVSFFQPFDINHYLMKLGLLDDFRQITLGSCYKSQTKQYLIDMHPKAAQTSKIMSDWLQSQQPLMLSIAQNFLGEIEAIITHAVKVRNLFVAVARHGIYDRRVVDWLYQEKLFWSDSQCDMLIAKYNASSQINSIMAEIFDIDSLLEQVAYGR